MSDHLYITSLSLTVRDIFHCTKGKTNDIGRKIKDPKDLRSRFKRIVKTDYFCINFFANKRISLLCELFTMQNELYGHGKSC